MREHFFGEGAQRDRWRLLELGIGKPRRARVLLEAVVKRKRMCGLVVVQLVISLHGANQPHGSFLLFKQAAGGLHFFFTHPHTCTPMRTRVWTRRCRHLLGDFLPQGHHIFQ